MTQATKHPMPNLTEIRARLRELLAKATPGEWRSTAHDGPDIIVNHIMVGDGKTLRKVVEVDPDGGFMPDEWDRMIADTDLIAESHNALPALLDEIDRLEEMVESARPCGTCNGDGYWYDADGKRVDCKCVKGVILGEHL